MATLRYLWIIETRAGRWKAWITKGKRGPMPDSDGFMTFEKKKYVIDPRKFRRWTVKRGILMRKKRIFEVQIWKENDPKPIDFLHVTSPDPRFTSEVIATMAKAHRVKDIIKSEQWDIVKVALILSLVMNFFVMLWLLSQVVIIK